MSLTLGSVGWGLWVLRAQARRAPEIAVARTLTILAASAAAVALSQTALLALKGRMLTETLGAGALGEFVASQYGVAGAARTLLALGLAAGAWWVGRAPRSRIRWTTLAILAVALAASGAWLTHATSRLEHRGALMALTVLHQVAVGIWIGGLIQLGGLWRLARRFPDVDERWAELVARFSRLALASVSVLVLTALPLAWVYTASLQGLVGTGYGSLVLTKAMLMALVLVLAAANFDAARAGVRGASSPALRARLPYLVEAEAIVLAMIVFAATALSAQPPPADQPTSDQATAREVLEVFRPKLPSLQTPSVLAMSSDRAVAAAGGERTREAYLWSNFSHNVAGLILLGMSLVALVSRLVNAAWGRHWPLGFVVLAGFIYLRAAANDGTWPFGAIPLSQLSAEAIQHRIAAILVVALGLLEWRARAERPAPSPLAYVFPVLGAAGAILLLTHSHTAFQAKSSFLVQVTHTTIGAFAVLLVAARWLELRLAPPAARIASVAASVAMLLIALVLVFYREANVRLSRSAGGGEQREPPVSCTAMAHYRALPPITSRKDNSKRPLSEVFIALDSQGVRLTAQPNL